MRKNTGFLGPFLVVLAAVFWGSMGIFVRRLTSLGFTSLQITSARLTLGALVFCAILLVRDPSLFRISRKDIPLFLSIGLLSVLFFTLCYFTAITMMPLSTAAILLYTSPIWIMLMSVIFFHENLTGRKILALCLAFCGCVLVSGVSGGGLSTAGLLYGLGAGFGYGLYSIFGTVALRRYAPLTVTSWAFILSAAGSWFLCQPLEMLAKISAAPSPTGLLLFFLLTAVVTAVVPYLSYTEGLNRMEASKAGILATIEPVVATLIGVILFSEPMTLLSGLGIVMILSAAVLLNLKRHPKNGD